MIEEKQLWTAVLLRGALDLAGVAIREAKRYQPRLQMAARAWFLSDQSEPGSFRWTCDQLGFDAPAIRDRLLALPPEELRHRLEGAGFGIHPKHKVINRTPVRSICARFDHRSPQMTTFSANDANDAPVSRF